MRINQTYEMDIQKLSSQNKELKQELGEVKIKLRELQREHEEVTKANGKHERAIRQLNQYILFQKEKIQKLQGGDADDDAEKQFLEALKFDDEQEISFDFQKLTQGLTDEQARLEVFGTKQKIPD